MLFMEGAKNVKNGFHMFDRMFDRIDCEWYLAYTPDMRSATMNRTKEAAIAILRAF